MSAAAAPDREVRNRLGMRLTWVPPGVFWMGSPEGEPGREDQERRHEVELTHGFHLGVHEVTVGQFRQFVAASGYRTDAERDGKGSYGANVATATIELDGACTWATPGFEQSDDHPVVHVSWHDTQAFCRWLHDHEGQPYRLPTEAQWEYACRAGASMAYAYGD
ncbi:MAG: formylglycine-generating enzyme family protein, partial [bacterium]|nr:formylglycine-generating enzyme family protein [bacterium]